MSSLRSDHINRVKIITSKFECLNGQTSNQNKNLNVRKLPLNRLKSDSCSEAYSSHRLVSNAVNRSEENFGSSRNFGNRKRLKERNEIDPLLKSSVDHDPHLINPAGEDRIDSSNSTNHMKEDENGDSPNGKLLIRQNSDPAKKLHRSPAFRCDRSEKIRDANSKNAFHKSPEFRTKSDRCISRDKLKRLGAMIEERLKEDELAFSGIHPKMDPKYNGSKNNGNDENTTSGVTNYEKMDECIDDALLNEMKNNENIPQHVLDMYAKVLKPRNRHCVFNKVDLLSKVDGVFSDSGVSSESENLISDDLEINNEAVNEGIIVDKENVDIVTNGDVDDSDESLSIDDEILNNNDALKSGLVSVNTLKKILKQPLPLGPPPKKPPRIFSSASSDTSSKSKTQNESKFRLKITNSKNKPHRSREESKLMLDKIENALNKYKNSGKILSPRLENSSLAPIDSISTTSTLPSNVQLQQAAVKNHESKMNNQPKEIHYMCTEILDLNFSDHNNLLNSSVSSEDMQSGNSFTKCLNSLNCVSNNGKNNHSSIFYTKFGSPPNSINNSFVEACCYCNPLNNKKQSDNGVRLSTFQNPVRSLDRSQNEKCKRCHINDVRQNNFKCHLDCKCVEDKVCGNSSFFINTESTSHGSQYGALIKSRSQEHIYDEPANVLPDTLNDDEEDRHMEIPPLTRSATQLEDAFFRFKTNTFSNGQHSSGGEFIRNDFKSKTLNRISVGNKESKVKDILKNIQNNNGKEGFLTKNGTSISRPEHLHYMCSNIYDASVRKDSIVPEVNSSGNSSNEFVPNSSALYDIHAKIEQKYPKKPPLYERRSVREASSTTRPQNLNLGSGDGISKVALLKKKFVNGPMTEEEKRNLDHLMTEIYDTVTAECMLESPNKDVKSVGNDGGSQSKEMAEASLKLTRSLTEKRKTYVRRVSSKVELIAPHVVGSIKRNRFSSLKTNNDKLSLSSGYDFKKVRAVFDSHVNNVLSDSASQEAASADVSHEDPPFKDGLFEACALIGMNLSTGQAVVKNVFPENAVLPPQIESLVFPESVDNNEEQNNSSQKQYRFELMAEDCQTYSLVLTNEHGIRSYAYCRRVIPEGAPFCLPLAYCIISPYRVPAFYYKVLLEVEIHHGSSEVVVRSILEQLYSEKLPKPGTNLIIKPVNSPKKSSLESFKKNSLYRSSVNLGDVLTTGPNVQTGSSDNLRRKSTDLSQKFPEIFSGANGLSMVQSLEKLYGDEAKKKNKSLTIDGNKIKRATSDQRVFDDRSAKTDDNSIKISMPLEPRLEEDNLSVLYESISVGVLVKIFGTLLLERKVILVSDKLSQLSSCIEALQLILYPFIWQHTIISTIPSYLRRDLLEAPIPILAGVLCSKCEPNTKRKRSDCEKYPNKEKSPKLENVSNSDSMNDFSIDDFYEDVKSLNFDEGMIVDITSRNNAPSEKIIILQGDESTLLPPVFSKTLSAALKLGPAISTVDAKSENHARKSRNILVAEAFLRFYLVLLGDYPKYLNSNDDKTDNNPPFDKENFIKNNSSKHIQYFLEWFTETAMFSNFIKNKSGDRDGQSLEEDVHSRLPYPDFYHLFDERLKLLIDSKRKHSDASKNPKHESGSNVKTNYKGKIKTWRAKLRDLIN